MRGRRCHGSGTPNSWPATKGGGGWGRGCRSARVEIADPCYPTRRRRGRIADGEFDAPTASVNRRRRVPFARGERDFPSANATSRRRTRLPDGERHLPSANAICRRRTPFAVGERHLPSANAIWRRRTPFADGERRLPSANALRPAWHRRRGGAGGTGSAVGRDTIGRRGNSARGRGECAEFIHAAARTPDERGTPPTGFARSTGRVAGRSGGRRGAGLHPERARCPSRTPR